MPTLSQLVRKGRKPKMKRKKSVALRGCPQKRAVCLNVSTMAPKKPNSACRAFADVKLSTGQVVRVYLRGEKHNLQVHSEVLVHFCKRRDLGTKYAAIRGVFAFSGVENRKTSRSKYGVKKEK